MKLPNSGWHRSRVLWALPSRPVIGHWEGRVGNALYALMRVPVCSTVGEVTGTQCCAKARTGFSPCYPWPLQGSLRDLRNPLKPVPLAPGAEGKANSLQVKSSLVPAALDSQCRSTVRMVPFLHLIYHSLGWSWLCCCS